MGKFDALNALGKARPEILRLGYALVDDMIVPLAPVPSQALATCEALCLPIPQAA